MKAVFASDSFKGSLSSRKINELLAKAAKDVWGECEIVPLPLADGGEGTLDAVLSVRNGKKIPVRVHDPLMHEITAYYGSIDDGTAVIEMAQASGLTLLSREQRNPLYTSSYGTGELILAALKAGHKELVIAIGGSATNDGGMGALTAMGIRFSDGNGVTLDGCGLDLSKVTDIDMCGLISEASGAHITVMCDVTNPLCGPMGASHIFGPQKGADEGMVRILEAGMQNYRDVIRRRFGIDPDRIRGAGAAGGMGAALRIFLGADLWSGIETLLDLCEFDRLITGADLIITGEGRIDGQSCSGKAVQGVGLRAKKAGIPCVAVCGCTGDGYEEIKEYGITEIVTLADQNCTAEYAMLHAEELYYQKAAGIMKYLSGKAEVGI
ncbi:MAG: glycerate kinase [Lachnospiraceae bacterium]|nr:glycerate kinase [Lachnospiraceae bacterium]